MRQLLNTLYVMTPGAYVRQQQETLRVEVNGETQLQVPLHHIGGVVCVGNVRVSPGVIERCANGRRFLTFLDQSGRFIARVEGPTSGNVLLRWAQHDAARDAARSTAIARQIVAGKIHNGRQVLMRGAREAGASADAEALNECASALEAALSRLPRFDEMDQIRGVEGESARHYFQVFVHMVRADREVFSFGGRNRRPPRDPINALLSFLYALLLTDCVAALEGVGLDPQVGYLHGLRPGRPALGLDLMEEFRPVLADRLALTLINRRQVQADDFTTRPGGSVQLGERARREVVIAYQARKQEEVRHPFLEERLPLGLIPHAQARLLARHLRGDLDVYPPFLYR